MKKHRAIRVFLTEMCNANCSNCFNRVARGGKEIDMDMFTRLCEYLEIAGFTSLKVMGGEPTTHSLFPKMIDTAQKYFRNISIFTNALNDGILQIEPREKDTIVYNMNFEHFLTETKLILNKRGRRTLKFQVTENTDISDLKAKIIKWTAFDPERIKTSFTFDCTSDIFKHREFLIETIAQLEEFMFENNLPFGFDHKVPICFYKGSSSHITYPAGLCRVETAGLIDANLNMRYCNQHNEIITSLLKSDGSFVPWYIVKNYLLAYSYKLQLALFETECKNCKFFGDYCNGGCWGGNATKEAYSYVTDD